MGEIIIKVPQNPQKRHQAIIPISICHKSYWLETHLSFRATALSLNGGFLNQSPRSRGLSARTGASLPARRGPRSPPDGGLPPRPAGASLPTPRGPPSPPDGGLAPHCAGASLPTRQRARAAPQHLQGSWAPARVSRGHPPE